MLLGELLRVWRHITMILHLSHHRHAACPPVQRVPDFKQHAFGIVPPLVVPKAQLLDTLRRQKLFSRRVASPLFRQTMLKTVEFNREERRDTIEVEKAFPRRMLVPELESGKPPRSQRTPKLLFFLPPAPRAFVDYPADSSVKRPLYRKRRLSPSRKSSRCSSLARLATVCRCFWNWSCGTRNKNTRVTSWPSRASN